MGLLLDTNAALWLLAQPERLGPRSRELLDEGPVLVSAASLWEVEIKRGLGKLTAPADLAGALRRSGLTELPISWPHTARLDDVELPHRDPVDRLLLAQARHERLDFLTADRVILAAGLPRVHDARQ